MGASETEREQSHDTLRAAAVIMGPPTVRGTQTFVHTLTECWRRPSLMALEVLWRWAFGVPALAALAYEGLKIGRSVTVDWKGLESISLLDPMAAAATMQQAVSVLWPPVWRVGIWLLPLLGVGWIVVSAIGRSAVLRRFDGRLAARARTLMTLQALRLVALAVSLAVWFGCLRAATQFAINGPIAAGEEPSLVLYCALAITATLGLFMLWSFLSVGLAAAPLLAMQEDLGAAASLAAAFRLGALRSKLVEINLVMGIVKIALIVLAMVLSACPLPFETVATPAFMAWWYAGVTILYFVASDFFHVVGQVAYVDLRNTYEPRHLVAGNVPALRPQRPA